MGWEELHLTHCELWPFVQKNQPKLNHPISVLLCLQLPRGHPGMCPAGTMGANPPLNLQGVFWGVGDEVIQTFGWVLWGTAIPNPKHTNAGR